MRQQNATEKEEVPLNRTSWRLRAVLGTSLSAVCVLLALLPLLRAVRGDAEGMAAFVALLILPVPVSLLISGVAMKRRWKPDLLFRALPIIVLAVMVMAFVWLGTR